MRISPLTNGGISSMRRLIISLIGSVGVFAATASPALASSKPSPAVKAVAVQAALRKVQAGRLEAMPGC